MNRLAETGWGAELDAGLDAGIAIGVGDGVGVELGVGITGVAGGKAP